MKPFTIEQLKALEIGDWVWIVHSEEQSGVYHRKSFPSDKELLVTSIAMAGLFYSSYGTKWLAYKNKEEAEGEYDSLAVENEVLKRDKENLERTIEEINEALKANGITIDSDGNIHDSRVEEAKKQTAKEILQFIFDDCKGQEKYLEENKERELDEYSQYSFYDGELASLGLIKNEVLLEAEKYGVEVDE